MNMRTANCIGEFGKELVELSDTVYDQELIINKYRLKTAMYKAFFFHERELAYKISDQIEENIEAEIGAFDGFSYSSHRASAVYRTLEDMKMQGIISEKEYQFCNE